MEESKKCLMCWSEFFKKKCNSIKVWGLRKFCSHKCWHEHQKKITLEKCLCDPKVCIVCWKTYYRDHNKTSLVQWNKSKHCSKKCNVISLWKAWSAYNKSKAIILPETKVCVICSKEYSRDRKNDRRWVKARNNMLCCWNECAIEYRKRQPYKQSRRIKLIKNGKCYWNRKMIVFARDDFTCQICWLRDPEIMEVDHKIERAIAPDLKNSLWNLRTLCPNCHARKTRKESKHHKDLIPRVKLLQNNPEVLKELLKDTE